MSETEFSSAQGASAANDTAEHTKSHATHQHRLGGMHAHNASSYDLMRSDTAGDLDADKRLRKVKSQTWDNFTWDNQFLPALGLDFDNLDGRPAYATSSNGSSPNNTENSGTNSTGIMSPINTSSAGNGNSSTGARSPEFGSGSESSGVVSPVHLGASYNHDRSLSDVPALGEPILRTSGKLQRTKSLFTGMPPGFEGVGLKAIDETHRKLDNNNSNEHDNSNSQGVGMPAVSAAVRRAHHASIGGGPDGFVMGTGYYTGGKGGEDQARRMGDEKAGLLKRCVTFDGNLPQGMLAGDPSHKGSDHRMLRRASGVNEIPPDINRNLHHHQHTQSKASPVVSPSSSPQHGQWNGAGGSDGGTGELHMNLSGLSLGSEDRPRHVRGHSDGGILKQQQRHVRSQTSSAAFGAKLSVSFAEHGDDVANESSSSGRNGSVNGDGSGSGGQWGYGGDTSLSGNEADSHFSPPPQAWQGQEYVPKQNRYPHEYQANNQHQQQYQHHQQAPPPRYNDVGYNNMNSQPPYQHHQQQHHQQQQGYHSMQQQAPMHPGHQPYGTNDTNNNSNRNVNNGNAAYGQGGNEGFDPNMGNGMQMGMNNGGTGIDPGVTEAFNSMVSGQNPQMAQMIMNQLMQANAAASGAGGGGPAQQMQTFQQQMMMQWMQQMMQQQQQQQGQGGNMHTPLQFPQASMNNNNNSNREHYQNRDDGNGWNNSNRSNGRGNGLNQRNNNYNNNNSSWNGEINNNNARRGGGRGGSRSGGPVGRESNGNNHSSSNSVTAGLLAEHKASGKRPQFSEIVGNVVEFSRDSHGSRFVQHCMETATLEQKTGLVNEVLADAMSLMQDLFGNYVIQNFLDHGTPMHRIAIAGAIKTNMLMLSTQPHGCRVVQRALDLLTATERNELLMELVKPSGNIARCARDPHATHVLQKAVLLVQRDMEKSKNGEDVEDLENSVLLLTRIEKIVSQEFTSLAVHPHACRLVQRTLGRCDPSSSEKVEDMLRAVQDSYHALSMDQHGNFILQHILDKGSSEQVGAVQAYVCSRVVELAQHKFGSHLVEKCLTSATQEQANSIVVQLIKPTDHNAVQGDDNETGYGNGEGIVLMALMKDPYANFVVQKAFDVSSMELKRELAAEIRGQAELLQRFTYGRHILAHIDRSGMA